MKKVITALSNPIVNKKLEAYEEIEIITNDIQYKEGILELLEIKKEIDFIILSELLPGKIEIKELIEEIQEINNKLQIIIILEKENKELENYLLAKGNITLFYNNKIEINKIAELIINKVDTQQLETEIKKLKEMILNKEIKNNDKINLEEKLSKNELINIEQEIENEYKKEKNKMKLFNLLNNKQEETNAKIISVSGNSGIGKSIFTVNIAKNLKKNKILIIDFDILNNSIHTLLGVEKYPNNIKSNIENKYYNYNISEIKEEDLIIKINKNIDLISGINLILKKENRTEEIKLLKILNNLKNKYDVIIIDTSMECFYDYTKVLMKNSDKIVFLSEANILQIKKSKKLLEIYEKEWNIKKEQINIVFNKNKDDGIDFYILKEIFKNYNIIGKINFINSYNNLINQNMNNLFLEKQVKKEYIKIGKIIMKNNELKKYYLNKIEKE